MNDVTRILSAIEGGDPCAAEHLLPLVYEELRKLAAAKLALEKPGQTLQATALVHEAYLGLVDRTAEQQWDCRGHFFAAAAEAMRRILVDRAREKGREKRGGKVKKIDIDAIDLATTVTPDQLLAVDEALAKLAVHDATAAKGAAQTQQSFEYDRRDAVCGGEPGPGAEEVERHRSPVFE
jgi:RNA polymerase sigma factor (TIGR02999 family)